MKKNNMLRIASVLLVAVLLSTCAISGVFANYYTKKDTADNAQVAKWGVVITPDENNDVDDLFYPTYDLGASDTSVVAQGDYDLVAPGTEAAKWTPFVVTGKPETDLKVTYTATVVLANWNDANGFYCPVIFTVNEDNDETKTVINGADYNNMTELCAAIKEAIELNTEAEYTAGTDLSDVKAPTISWVWNFGDDAATKVRDTYLGDQAALGNPATISISIVAEVEQLD